LKHGVPQVSVIGPLWFIKKKKKKSENKYYIRTNIIILFADDTSVIISSRNFKGFCSVSNLGLSHMIKWLAGNSVINLDDMKAVKFIIQNSSHSTVHNGYKEKYIEETINTQFLGLQVNNYINWKNHVDKMIHS